MTVNTNQITTNCNVTCYCWEVGYLNWKPETETSPSDLTLPLQSWVNTLQSQGRATEPEGLEIQCKNLKNAAPAEQAAVIPSSPGWIILSTLWPVPGAITHPPPVPSALLCADRDDGRANLLQEAKELSLWEIPGWVLSLLPSVHDLWSEVWVHGGGLHPSTPSNPPLTPREIGGLHLRKRAACLTGLWKSLQNTVVISGRDSFRLCAHPLSFLESWGLTGSLHTLSAISAQRGGKIKHHQHRCLLPWKKAGNVIKNFNYNWHFWVCCCRRPSCQNWQRKTPQGEALNYISDHFINHSIIIIIIKTARVKLSV